MSQPNSVSRAVRRASQALGSDTALGKACGVSQAAISNAYRRGRVSMKLALKIERATKGLVDRKALLPELFAQARVA